LEASSDVVVCSLVVDVAVATALLVDEVVFEVTTTGAVAVVMVSDEI
jgi:hypothetical protein